MPEQWNFLFTKEEAEIILAMFEQDELEYGHDTDNDKITNYIRNRLKEPSDG